MTSGRIAFNAYEGSINVVLVGIGSDEPNGGLYIIYLSRIGCVEAGSVIDRDDSKTAFE